MHRPFVYLDFISAMIHHVNQSVYIIEREGGGVMCGMTFFTNRSPVRGRKTSARACRCAYVENTCCFGAGVFSIEIIDIGQFGCFRDHCWVVDLRY